MDCCLIYTGQIVIGSENKLPKAITNNQNIALDLKFMKDIFIEFLHFCVQEGTNAVVLFHSPKLSLNLIFILSKPIFKVKMLYFSANVFKIAFYFLFQPYIGKFILLRGISRIPTEDTATFLVLISELVK